MLRVLSHLIASLWHPAASLQAAGLTLLTLLSLVPVLALLFAIAKAMGFAERLEAHLVDLSREWPNELAGAVDSLRQMVAGVNFGALGLIGLGVVVWSGLSLFGRVELALNQIWRSERSRAWLRRVTDFVTLMVVVPPLGLVAIAGSALLGSVQQIEALRQYTVLAWMYGAGLGFVPHVMLWIAFAALYRILPNAPVQWRAALVGGIVAGSTLILLNGIYVKFQVGVANANALYGTLAALPLLLIYLQMTWTVVLAGALIAYAVQHVGSLHGPGVLPPASFAVRQRLAWHLVSAMGTAFRAGDKGARVSAVCQQLDVPREWVEEVVAVLCDGGVAVQVASEPDLLVPARPPEQVTPGSLLQLLDGSALPEVERVRLPEPTERLLAQATAAAAAAFGATRF